MMLTHKLSAFVLFLPALSSGIYSSEFRNSLAKRIRIYHDVYFQQNFPSRREPDIRVLTLALFAQENQNYKQVHIIENTQRAAPVRMMIGNSPRSEEYDAFPEDNKRAAPVRMMIGNSPRSEEFATFSGDSKSAGPVKIMIGNSPTSEEFASFSENTKRAAPVRMMIGNSPKSEEFAAFSEDTKRAAPVRMMIGNSPRSEEFAAFSEDTKRVAPVRMMIGNSPKSEEFAAFSEDNKRAAPVRMMIGNSPQSEEFAAFSEDTKRAAPERMMIGNSPKSKEFAAFSEDNKRATPVRMMIGNSPRSEEFAAFSEDTKRAAPVRMMIGNSPKSEEFAALAEDTKRAAPVRMMIGNSPQSEEFAAFSEDIKRAAPVRMMIGNSPKSNEFASFFDGSKRSAYERMMDGNSPRSEDFSVLPKQKKRIDHKSKTAQNSETPAKVIVAEYTSTDSGIGSLSCNNSFPCRSDMSHDDDTKMWLIFLDLIHKNVDKDIEEFHTKWEQHPRLLNNELRDQFQMAFPAISLQEAIENLCYTDTFFQLFWPFSFDVSLMNQQLALFGISGELYDINVKTKLFRELNDFQAIKVPAAENKIILSFDHPHLVDGMNRSSLLQNSYDFINKGKHLFNKTEANEIRGKVNAAFKLINRVSPGLYRSIKQLIGCIAFYKAEDQIHLGGSVSSALGVIWLDPSTNYNWSIPFFAEQIVHEFTHNALFYEELVHGTFTDHAKFPQAKVMSAIRRQLRDYDKSFHAAYVSTGLIVFHSKAGYQQRAFNLARPLPSSVRDLVEVNKRTQILTRTGEAMLQTMVDFITLARLEPHFEMYADAKPNNTVS